MPVKKLNKFFLSIVIPSLLAIILFVFAMYFVFLPNFEKAIMDDKKEMISELTNTAWSLLEEYENEFQKGALTREDAQKLAIERVAEIRYGSERKDYFWIIDRSPKMILHPYRPELNGSDLNQYADPKGKKLFVEATKVVQDDGEGYIDYMWQWKDDSTQIVPKLSYVKSFETWGWIIGTGIYLDDVHAEIKQIKARLLRISLVITLIIIGFLLFVIRQSLNIENKRQSLTSELRLSQQKYKTLVDASTEETLMFLQEKIIFSNAKFIKLSGYDHKSIQLKSLKDIFDISWEEINMSFKDSATTISMETKLFCANGATKDVVMSISRIKYNKQEGYIMIPKELSKKKLIEQESEKLTGELQTSLMLMKQPIHNLIKEMISIDAAASIQEAAEFMTRKNCACLFIKQNDALIGVVSNSDFKKRVIARNLDLQKPVTQIMTAPIISISEDALLYEAMLKFHSEEVSFLAALSSDYEYTGVLSHRDVTAMQMNTVSYFMKEIEIAESVDELVQIHKKVPVLVNALIESGDKTANITGIISSISDAFTRRVIDLGLEKMGPAPCEFAFMVMGSEGRMEQTLSTDQDNAIIFEDIPEEKLPQTKEYFVDLGYFIADSLDKIGYKLCNGGIMASNTKWNQPLQVWKDYFSHWMNTADVQSIVEASIFFDFRGIYGNQMLVDSLREYVFESLPQKRSFLHYMAQSVSNYKSPVGLFGNLVGNDGSGKEKYIDIKMILHPVVKFCRLYSLQYGIDETNTLVRIKKLYEKSIISKESFDELSLSYNYLMQLCFRAQAAAMLRGQEPNKKLDISELTQIEVGTLKKIFSEVNSIPARVNNDFRAV